MNPITILWIVFILAIIITGFIVVAAIKSSKQRSQARQSVMEKVERMHYLKATYRTITSETFNAEPSDELFEGVAMNIQFYLEQFTNMDGEFEKLPIEKQYVYVLYYMFLENNKTMLDFFIEHNAVLVDLALPAVRDVIEDERLTALMSELYDMSESGDENISFDKEKGEYLSRQCDSCKSSLNIKEVVSNYIRERKEIFIYEPAKK